MANEMEQMNYGLKCKHKIAYTHGTRTREKNRNGRKKANVIFLFSILRMKTNERTKSSKFTAQPANQTGRPTGKDTQSHASFYYLLCVVVYSQLPYTLCVFSYFYSKVFVCVSVL